VSSFTFTVKSVELVFVERSFASQFTVVTCGNAGPIGKVCPGAIVPSTVALEVPSVIGSLSSNGPFRMLPRVTVPAPASEIIIAVAPDVCPVNVPANEAATASKLS